MGQWHSDMKHGRGKLTFIDSEEPPIYGSWANDKLDGLATQGESTTLYKEGLEIELSGRGMTCSRAYKAFCGLLALCLIYGIPVYIITQGIDDSIGYVWLTVIIWLMY